MNKEMARRLIALALSSKKGADSITENDLTKELSLKRHLLSQENVTRLVQESVNDGLLTVDSGKLKPNFTVSGISVPLDFSVSEKELFSISRDKPLSDRLLEYATSSGTISKKEIIRTAGDFLKTMKFLDFETALLAVMQDMGLTVDEYIREII